MPVIALIAETTGLVWQVLKQPGDEVAEDEAVVIIESMKMEIPVLASDAGRIVEVLVRKDDAVKEGQIVAKLETQP
jgi:acetyl-CoA carboxylase biotin carboxyl carrier protein